MLKILLPKVDDNNSESSYSLKDVSQISSSNDKISFSINIKIRKKESNNKI